jgi:thiosulfate/3-mercaptopyruvate sulfurtransferase
VLIIFLIVGTSVKSQDLISVDSLLSIRNNKDVVIVDARSKTDFESDVHIKNAVNIPYDTLQTDDPILGLIKQPKVMADILGAFGLSNDKLIVVYDEGSNKYSGRLYWILKYLGGKDVKILNGNLKKWKKISKEVTNKKKILPKTIFKFSINKSILATVNDIKGKDIQIVDARSVKEYRGKGDYSKGHIPGAYNVEYKNVLNTDGTFKTKKELSVIFKNIDRNKVVVAYCRTSVRASTIYFALHSVLGYEKVKLYDGAYSEWVYLENRVEK